MIIPSCVVTDEENLVVEQEVDGMYSLSNAYEGEYQEFFEGRPTRLNLDGEAVREPGVE